MITTDFLSTVTLKQSLDSLFCLTFKVGALRKGKQNELLIDDLKKYFDSEDISISLFYNARSALHQYLLSLKLENGSEVILCGYNCVSVSNAVLQTGLQPIYTDIEGETLGIDYDTLEKNIGSKTKVIIIQHSFGTPSRDTEKIIAMAREKNIKVVEDVAHGFGVEIGGRKLGLLSDASIFSTGRDKVISSVNGGFLIENYKESILTSESLDISMTLIIRNHLYNILGYLACKTYSFGKIGKVIMFVGRRFKFFPDILSKAELSSHEKELNYSLPNSLAYLIRKELVKIDKYKEKRKKHSLIYQNSKNIYLKGKSYKESNYFREVHICENKEAREKLLKYMKSQGALLGTTWTEKNIAPQHADQKKSQYKPGSCPVAEGIAERLVFLPNAYNANIADIEKVAEYIDNYYEKNV